MKNIALALVLSGFMLTSCGYYYQVYNVKPEGEIKMETKFLTYEDENCVVSYDFWSESGNPGFIVYNKTNANIYIDLEESFFIMNGTANNYYKQRTYSNSSSLAKYMGSAVGSSVMYTEEKIICIPPQSSKKVSEYVVTKSLLKNCDLPVAPSAGKIKSLYYSKEDTPVTFENRIAYGTSRDGELTRFSNKFYIDEITNYPEKKIMKYSEIQSCDSVITKVKEFKQPDPNKFYIKYQNNSSF